MPSQPKAVAKEPAPPRVRGVKRPPMKRAFIGNYLDAGKRTRRRLRTNSDVSKFIVQQSLRDLGGEPILGPDRETDEMIARMMASEINAAINREGGKSARNWYTGAIRAAIEVAALMQPEILDNEAARKAMPGVFSSSSDARTILFCAMAITSQSVPVNENMRYALEQYRHFLKHGAFQPKAYGVKGSSIRLNLKRFNHMLEVLDGRIDELKGFLDAPFSMRELRAAGEKHGIRIGGKEMLDEVVSGSILFGPKIGAFYQNLRGNFSPLTMDLWFCRTWGRYTGTLVRDDVSPQQIDRLTTTLRKDFLEFSRLMEEAGIELDIDALEDAENDELLALCRDVHKFWELRRTHLVEAGFDNRQTSAFKSALGWPGAAESIIKSLTGTVDAPTSGGQRRWMRTVMRRCLQILERNGISMTVADAQAILWYPEKELYDHLANRKSGSLTVSYDEAMSEIASKEGIADELIEQALRAGRDAERGPGVPGAAGQRLGAVVQGHDQGPGGHQASQARGQGEGEGVILADPDGALPPRS